MLYSNLLQNAIQFFIGIVVDHDFPLFIAVLDRYLCSQASPEAMLQVEERLPSREVKVLMSTLVIASRSGGSLVQALRDISYMLDERKETKREVKSVIAQSVATGYAIILIGIVLILVVNGIFPGTIERMTQSIIGIAALVFYALMTILGIWLIRRITRLDA